MDGIESKRQARFQHQNPRSGLSIYRELSRTRPIQPHNNSENDHHPKCHRYNVNIYSIAKKLCLLIATTAVVTPAYAADVGGVSATANPIANSSGSVTNQAIQVLQGPYITNTYGGQISCQGPTMNITPYVTGSVALQRPWEEYYDDPVYNVHDADDDGQIDNPGDILYYMPTRTGQKDNYNVSLGLSATWSRPLDKTLQDLCKNAAATQIGLQKQLTANKRLDFEIARLKNCGELMKAGIMFHPKSPYAAVCADVVLTNPAGVVADHTHGIQIDPVRADGTAADLGSHSIGASSSSTPVSPSSDPVVTPSVPVEKASQVPSSPGFFARFRWPFLSRDEKPSEADQPEALLGGPIQLPPSQSQPSSKQSEE